MDKNLKIVVFASSLHNKETLLETRSVLFNELRSVFDVELIESSKIEDLCSTGNLVIAFIATGGVEESFAKHYKELSNPIVILSDSFHNSLAASLEISTWLNNNGIRHKHINFPIEPSRKYLEELEEELSELQKIQSANYKLSKTVVGLIGGESSWLISSKVNLDPVKKRFGTKFKEIPISKLQMLFENEGRLDTCSKSLLSNLIPQKEVDRSESDIMEALKLYNSLKKLITEYDLNALTIKCFDLLSSCKTTSCLALSLLNDNGVVSGCEGDIPSLWSMLISRTLCDSASFMANPSSIERGDNSIDFAHCTAPISLSKSFKLPSHYESKIGIGVAAQFPLGKYTLFKCGGQNLDKFYAFEGDIIQNTSVIERCRTQVKFQFKSVSEIDEFLESYIGNHTILIPGKHKKELSDFFKLY